MPSVKSYQNRKKDIELLEARVRVLEGQLSDSESQLSGVEQEYIDYQKNHAARCSQLETENRVLKARVDMDQMVSNLVSRAETQIIDALHNKVLELERKVRIYRQYIRYGEAYYPEHHTETINIPACLKPLDALEYIGKKIENGPDCIPQ